MVADLERYQFTSLRLQPGRSPEIRNSGLRSKIKNGYHCMEETSTTWVSKAS